MAGHFRLACIQVNAGNEIAPNVEAARRVAADKVGAAKREENAAVEAAWREVVEAERELDAAVEAARLLRRDVGNSDATARAYHLLQATGWDLGPKP